MKSANMIHRIFSLLTNRKALKNAIKNRYRWRCIPSFCIKQDLSDCITDPDEASELIRRLLESNEPCMISRFGSVEFTCMINFIRGKHPLSFLRKIFPFWMDESIPYTMSNNAGFFSKGNENYCRFADLLYDSARQADVLGSWMEAEKAIDKDMHYKKCKLRYLEPFFSTRPWTSALEGKRVVVIHPFADTIKRQYEKRALLFDNPDMIPTFKSLTVIKSVQSIGGENGGFATWFDALHYMEEQIDALDYDVAIIGCGAYGMPLAAHCKKMGKKAVHLGGATQLLFGIKGRRWETEGGEDYRKLLSNPNWVRPSEDEKPKAAKDVENGCYW